MIYLGLGFTILGFLALLGVVGMASRRRIIGRIEEDELDLIDWALILLMPWGMLLFMVIATGLSLWIWRAGWPGVLMMFVAYLVGLDFICHHLRVSSSVTRLLGVLAAAVYYFIGSEIVMSLAAELHEERVVHVLAWCVWLGASVVYWGGLAHIHSQWKAYHLHQIRLADGLCPDCGYDMQGNVTATHCPECGRAVEPCR